MIYFVLFSILSIILLVFTLGRPHRHRFYRFFAFECLLALILLNAESWFQNPLSAIQLLSWLTLAGSLILALHGFRLLRRVGVPDEDWENTTHLVTVGAYRYIRHPLYCSLLLLGLGAYLKDPSSILGLALLLILFACLYATARVEEVDNLKRFGEAYRAYQAETKMFIPYLL